MNLNEIDDFDEGLEKDLIDNSPESNNSLENSNFNDSEVFEAEDSNILEDENMEDTDDLITALLKSKQINPDSVKFQNETGEIEEKAFDDLTKDEQLQILGMDESDDNYGLENEEVNLINQLRLNNLSVRDYNNYIAKQAIENYIKSTNAGIDEMPEYQVDSISDDELFLIDLKARIPDISDDDAISELTVAKANEDLYNRKVESIREEYKQQEDLILEEDQRQREAKQAQEAQMFESSIVDAIQRNDSIDLGESSLSLSVDDKNDIASFILDTDAAGTRYIAKALNDPQTLVKMVWYALKGEEAFDQISDYYKNKISEAAKYNYNRGYEDAKGGKSANTSKSIVKRHTARRGNEPLTINDID